MATGPDRNFAGCLVNRLGKHSFLIDAATGYTIAPTDLPGLIAGFGCCFSAAGLRAGDRVLLGSSLSPLSGLAYLGAMYAGLVPAPVDERSLVSSGAGFVEAISAKAVWTEQNPSFDWICKSSVLSLHGDLTGGTPQAMPPIAREDSDLATLMATSGSTGVPRFVMVSHGNLIANTEAIVRSQQLLDDELAMLILPLSYCFGASVFHTHLYQGGGVVFDRRFMFPDKVLQAINRYGCTTLAGVPSVYNTLLDRSNIRSIAMPRLRRLLQAGGSLPTHRIRQMRNAIPTARFYVMYGQTEATARISCLEPERLEEKLGSAGRPLDNLVVRIVNEHGNDLPSGHIGEIWVKGPSITHGYLNDPDETLRVFTDGWLRTRDLGYLDAEGYLWIRGRVGGFVKMCGVRVSFDEVEARVAAIPGVFECAAAATIHPEAGEALVLFVVPKKGEKLRADEIRYRLPAHWVVNSIQFVHELPKNANGKISREALTTQLGSIHGAN